MLRDYQEEAVKKMLWAKDLPGNDIVVAPMGSGKSHIIAEFAYRLNEPILILVPNKELLEQDLDKLSRVVDKSRIGVFSASMKSREIGFFTLATIQSAKNYPEYFKSFNYAIVDEANNISPKRLEGMYNVFFREINIKKVYGLTASPYRQDIIYRRWGRQKWQVDSITTTKMINRYPLREQFWRRMLYVIDTQTLIDQGFLCPTSYQIVGSLDHSQIPTNKSQSDFDMEEFDKLIKENYSLEAIAKYIENIPQRSKLVFCSSISQAEELKALISGSELVTGTTPKKEREKTVSDLKAGRLSTLLNVNLFIYGFDYPELEAVVLLRPTRSLALHTQAIGRVSRIAEGKSRGYVYDFVSNVKNLGKIEEIKIEKIEGKWNVTGGAFPQGFHNQELYKFRLKRPK